MTIACAHCGTAIYDGSSFCPQCGQSAASEPLVCAAPGLIPPQPQPAVAGAPIAAPFSNVLLDDTSHLQGIGGWLILVAIGLVLSPIVILLRTLLTLVPVLLAERMQYFLQTHPVVHAIIIAEVATNAVMLLHLLRINFLFFTRKRAFPSFLIFYFVFQLLITLADGYAAYRTLPGHTHDVGAAPARAILAALIWIPYLLLSRRVKATFVH